MQSSKILSSGVYLSEAALWTRWEHLGDLVAESDGRLLALGSTTFLDVILDHDVVTLFAIRYAHQFLRALNAGRAGNDNDVDDSMVEDADDLFIFRPDESIDLFDEEENESEDHLIFLSHFKAEAGTEATLMQEALTLMVKHEEDSHEAQRFQSPIFLDSEDLEDLSTLTNHVQRSHNLVLLLTPSVFQRPWCLVEIVTAVDNGIPFVPVEVQRPGIKFQYPDETFYAELKAGHSLTHANMQILKNLEIGLAEVEDAIRQVFTHCHTILATQIRCHKESGAQ
jgi:hypothetical protein